MKNDHTHLAIADCEYMFQGIINEATKASIEGAIGKDVSTVGKEIKLTELCLTKCNFG